ncbi:hypothetical protein AB0F91_03745 [Amycolatopsis sp. NPDC023774]
MGVGKIVVGVADQSPAKKFWSAIVGFTATADGPTTTRPPLGRR